MKLTVSIIQQVSTECINDLRNLDFKSDSPSPADLALAVSSLLRVSVSAHVLLVDTVLPFLHESVFLCMCAEPPSCV